ncbi:phosphatidylinositol-specific phospholipase C [Agrobacterium tumefaciens]|nr:phosphatidylinositol-specific phospholipase C [Agrobacterium tumefaciens]NTE22263.1 phosphatidylinositol-specific phospholipase C [Agrobacterium tumefaciens]
MKKNLLHLLVGFLFFIGCKKEENQSLKTSTDLPAREKFMMTGPLNNKYNLSNWMGSLADLTSIAQLSIPGSHNAAAKVEYIWGTAKCQNLNITEQLNSGVRFLDIRCRHLGNAFVIHHGEVYQKINFQDVLNACYNFLNRNPSEAILMSIKEEYNAQYNSRSFEQTFDSYVKANPTQWNLQSSSGILGNTRGKIKLIRRFGAKSVKGVDASKWFDNAIFDVQSDEAPLKVQDIYRVSKTNIKSGQVMAFLKEARISKIPKLYINFASGYKSSLFGIPDITSVSRALNPAISTYLNANKQGRYGIIAADFISEGLSRQIVASNFY